MRRNVNATVNSVTRDILDCYRIEMKSSCWVDGLVETRCVELIAHGGSTKEFILPTGLC